MFKRNDKVLVELEPDVLLRGVVIRVTDTDGGVFYGVRLHSGRQIHGLDAECLRPDLG